MKPVSTTWLNSYVNRNYNCEGITHVMPHIAHGLQYLHSKDIVHRDVKPGNVLVSNQHHCSITGEKEFRDLWESRPIVCKLTDFGESKSCEIQTKSLIQTKTARLDRGTPTYMAPEILLSEKRIHVEGTIEDLERADIWAYGMILFLVCNPQLGFPYQEDMKKCQTKVAGIESLLKDGKRSTFGENYRQLVKTGEWRHLYRVHEACTCFEPEQRPSAADILTLLLERDVEASEVRQLNQSVADTTGGPGVVLLKLIYKPQSRICT